MRGNVSFVPNTSCFIYLRLNYALAHWFSGRQLLSFHYGKLIDKRTIIVIFGWRIKIIAAIVYHADAAAASSTKIFGKRRAVLRWMFSAAFNRVKEPIVERVTSISKGVLSLILLRIF